MTTIYAVSQNTKHMAVQDLYPGLRMLTLLLILFSRYYCEPNFYLISNTRYYSTLKITITIIISISITVYNCQRYGHAGPVAQVVNAYSRVEIVRIVRFVLGVGSMCTLGFIKNM